MPALVSSEQLRHSPETRLESEADKEGERESRADEQNCSSDYRWKAGPGASSENGLGRSVHLGASLDLLYCIASDKAIGR